MEEIVINLKNTGVASVVIAILTIIIVGLLKQIPGWDKVKKDGRKAIYQTLNVVISGGLSILYFILIFKGGWTWALAQFVLISVVQVNALYPLYENLGLRALVRKIFALLAPSKVSTTEVEQVQEEKKVADAAKKKVEDKEWLA